MEKPQFIAIAAITIDGKIALNKNHPSDWTSPEDKIFMRALLNKCDAVLVGNNTYKTAMKPLSKRNCIVLTKSVNQSIKKSNSLLLVNPSKIDVKQLVSELGYKKIAILGGAQTYSSCLQNAIMDELYLTIEPVVFGKGIDLFDFPPSPLARGDVPSESRGTERSNHWKFRLISSKLLNSSGTILLHYKK